MTSLAPISLVGKVLYLTADLALIRAQLAGEITLRHDPQRALLENVSTDEIAPGWAGYYYDDTLARFCLVGLRGGVVTTDAIRQGGFRIIVSGRSKGCGSSRETAPYAEQAAGIAVVFAVSMEKIYQQNAENIGLLTSTDFTLLARLEQGEIIDREPFAAGRDPISADVVRVGGLFAFNRLRAAGRLTSPPITTPPRPMTLGEKIFAAHAVCETIGRSAIGVSAVQPGDACFVRADVRFSHEYVTPMADTLFRRGFGQDARVAEPATTFAFRDHLTLLDQVMAPEQRAAGFDKRAADLAVVQDAFTKRHGIRLYGEVMRNGQPAGSEAICHTKMVEDLALPGQLVVGTDSHTCTAGALGCIAFGVGATDMANAWATRDVRVRVPESVRVVLAGSLRRGVCAKDVMLHLLAMDFFRSGRGLGKLLEFVGPGLVTLPIEERATLSNMAVEAGGFSGVVEADETVVRYLVQRRGLNTADVRARIVRADAHAMYAATLLLDLTQMEPMVATPGDPRNGQPLRTFRASAGRTIPIHIAYGGSCTGGKQTDMDMYAAVFAAALAAGRRVATGLQLYIQFGSQTVRQYAVDQGYVPIFEKSEQNCSIRPAAPASTRDPEFPDAPKTSPCPP